MSLHCLVKADAASVTRLTRLVDEDDAILLIGAAVTCARVAHALLEELLASGAALHALEEDLALYGVEPDDARVSVVDYAAWVDLATRHDRQLEWR